MRIRFSYFIMLIFEIDITMHVADFNETTLNWRCHYVACMKTRVFWSRCLSAFTIANPIHFYIQSNRFFVCTFTFVEMQEKWNTLWIKLSAKLYQLSYKSIDKTLASCLMFRTYGNNITYHIHFRFYIRQARIIHTVSYFHKNKKYKLLTWGRQLTSLVSKTDCGQQKRSANEPLLDVF